MSIRAYFANYHNRCIALGTLAVTSISAMVSYQIHSTIQRMSSIVKTGVLDKDYKLAAQYIYVEDPLYELKVKEQQDNERKLFGSFTLWWEKIKHSIAARLLQVARNGNMNEQVKAIEWLAKIQNLKDWDYLTLAQMMDAKTAVGLARTPGVDLRFFLPPPKYLRSNTLNSETIDSNPLAFSLRDLIKILIKAVPHRCISYFLSKHFTTFQDLSHFDYSTASSTGIDATDKNLTLLCLEAILHHLSATSKDFNTERLSHINNSPPEVGYDSIKNRIQSFIQKQDKGLSSVHLASKNGLLYLISKAIYRYPNEKDYQIICAKLLSRLSVHNDLLEEFFHQGLVGALANWLRSSDINLSALAAQSLANLDKYHYEKYGCYHPDIYLLHPMYRTQEKFCCDVVFAHGLLGGVFVTWRQRDITKDKKLKNKNKRDPASGNKLKNKEVSSSDMAKLNQKLIETTSDLNVKAVIEDIKDLEQQDWDDIGSDLDVVMHDIPESAQRETPHEYVCNKTEDVYNDEIEDQNVRTSCWPKDWLPKDIKNIRIMALSYESALSEWRTNCPLERKDGSLTSKAHLLGWGLRGAGVGDCRPITWISHSMGGLLVKQILTEAEELESSGGWETNGLARWTRSLVFYSTPHRGSALAAAAAGTPAVAAVLWPSRDVHELKENSPTLLELHKKWLTLVEQKGWEVIGFAESLPMLISSLRLPFRLVAAESADAGIGAHYEMSLDHLTICKPATRHSFIYYKVLELVHHASDTRCFNLVCDKCLNSKKKMNCYHEVRRNEN